MTVGPSLQRPRHLVLVGLSYSGKSTVGALAAARLGLPLVDTDQEVERRLGLSVPLIFAQQGETAFREAERQIVAEVVAGPPSVIATGGGAPMDERSRRLLWAGNLVILLEARLEVIVARMRDKAGQVERPLLSGDDPLARLRALAEQRRAVYEQAHLVIRTDDRSAEEAASAVCAAFRGAGGPRGHSAPPSSKAS